MPAVLRYARTFVRVPKTMQRVRLPATAAPDVRAVFNLTSAFGNYARASARNGGIYWAYTHDPVPFLYEFEGLLSNTSDATEPRFCFTSQQHIRLVYTRGGAVQERLSTDDGKTWTGEALVFAASRHPDIAADGLGTLLRAAYQPASGKITATRQDAGEATAGSPFFLKNTAATDLTIEDDTFRLVADLKGWWWLHLRLLGGATSSLLFSTDDGETFAVTSGAVTGITGGTHPGMLAGHDGTLWAWAYLGGEIAFTRRGSGEVDWSTPVSIQDHLGVDLAVRDIPSSLALAWERPQRLVLATILTAHVGPTDHWSADDGSSFRRFVGT